MSGHYQAVELATSPRYRDTPHDYFAGDNQPQRPMLYGNAGPQQSQTSFGTTEKYGYANENSSSVNLNSPNAYRTPVRQQKSNRKKWLIIGGAVLLVIIIAGAAVGGYFGAKAKKDPSGHVNGDGTMITAENGVSFRYNNSFGGWFAPVPFDFSAQVRSDVKPLSEQWDWTNDRIHGVNLGGWFVLEPFITPLLFEPYAGGANPVVDEWGLSERLGSNLSTALEDHYNTFITEIDFAQIAGAGLEWVRLPVPYWFIETLSGEPFLEGVGWKYVLKALEWARKYGLRMEFDFHAMPGSQNGQNHSGRVGTINLLTGMMGIVNAQRSINYLRTWLEFICQPQYAPIVPLFAVGNEIAYDNIGALQVRSFYLEVYEMMRSITGIGEGNGPMMVIHDGFAGLNVWPGFMTGADRLALETHYYLAYSPDLFITDLAHDLSRPCVWWQPGVNASLNNFGVSFGGEWCLAINDCGQWINGMGFGSHYGGNYNSTPTTPVGDCGNYVNYKNFSPAFKTQMQQLTQMYMDMTRSTFFWSWKMGVNSTGEIPNPLWSYSLGLQEGWIPKDPRGASNACQRIPAEINIEAPSSVPWNPPFSSWMTGGSGANTMAAAATSNYTVWPPTTLIGTPTVSNLYSYTPTGSPITLSAMSPTYTPTNSASAAAQTSWNTGNGWANAQDTAGYYTASAGCSYLNAYSGSGVPYPTDPPCA